jgi:tRNA (mo5U34)-methyltransferase
MQQNEALAAIADHPGWYHTIDLGSGVSTPGFVDLRPFLKRSLPRDLTGKRCLDVGTFDGFWAFAMEDRGAQSVVAIDVDDTSQLEHPPLRREANIAAARASGVVPGVGFALAAAARSSAVRRVSCNVYDLDVDAIGGPVDFVLVGTILQHLRDPVRALERVRSVLAPGGTAVLVETISTRLTWQHPRSPVGQFRPAMPDNSFTWWVPNLSMLKAWPTAAGMPPTSRLPVLHRPVRGAGKGDWVAAVRVAPSVSR